MIDGVAFARSADRLEVTVPWLGTGKRIAVSFVYCAAVLLWLLSEWAKIRESPAHLLVPLPMFLCLGYLILVLATGSSRLTFHKHGVSWRYGGPPSLPARDLARGEILGLCYWEQVIASKYGSRIMGVAGLECADGTRPVLFDTLPSKDAAREVAEQVAAWWNANLAEGSRELQVWAAGGRPKKVDMTVLRRLAGATGVFCLVLAVTAILSEHFRL